MENLLAKILNNIELSIAIVTALGALVATVVAEYIKIRKLLAEKSFLEIAAPLSATAETTPLKVLNGLINPPVNPSPLVVNSNEGKALIVAQATIEQAKKEKPSILKRLGINSALDAVPLVSSLYQSIIKPILKRK